MIEPLHLGDDVTLYNGDCLVAMRQFQDNSIDSIVTDPPGGISFMGKEWDKDKGGRDHWIAWMTEVAAECLRVLKPGGHAVVWSIPRTSHWTATAWENAGFEVRDRIAHVFGSGFPKSRDIGKDVDKIFGKEREIIGKHPAPAKSPGEVMKTGLKKHCNLTIGYSDWEGWGTALKPAVEDYWLFRKPISEKTVAQNVLKWGTGALNIDACRIESESIPINKLEKWSGFGELVKPEYEQVMNDRGRWPANLVHDGSDEVVGMFPVTESGKMGANNKRHTDGSPNGIYGKFDINHPLSETYGDNGSAARFFYCAKPTKEERNRGLQGMDEKIKDENYRKPTGNEMVDRIHGCGKPTKNNHATVKAIALMTYLIKLVTPPKGIVLDPFLGSGSTLVAAVKLGFKGIGVDSDEKEGYMDIAIARIKHEQRQMRLDI